MKREKGKATKLAFQFCHTFLFFFPPTHFSSRENMADDQRYNKQKAEF